MEARAVADDLPTRGDAHLGQIAGPGDRHSELGDVDPLGDRLQLGPVAPSGLEHLGQGELLVAEAQLADELRHLFEVGLAAGVEAEQLAQFLDGDAEVVARGDQRRAAVGQGDFGAQHIELCAGAGLVAVAGVLQLLLQQGERLVQRRQHLRGRREPPLAVAFHRPPLIVQVEADGMGIAGAGRQGVPPDDGESDAGHALQAFVGRSDERSAG